MRSWGEVALSAKTSALTALGTVASGLAQILGMIPDEIGKLATLMGICLTIVMINHWRIQTKKAQIELDNLIMQRNKLRGE